MAYGKRDLIEASGLPDRTIRNYIVRGLIPRPKGHGLAAEYSEDAMIRAVAIGRMRAEGQHIDLITEKVARWTQAEFREFVDATAPRPSPPDDAAPEPAPPPVVDGTLERRVVRGEGGLREAPCYHVVTLLPGITLMVDADAPEIVLRIATEICERYGQRARPRAAAGPES
jgi:hypothetical protein